MKYTSDKSDTLKKKTLETLEKSFGVVTTACKNVGIARSTFYEWLKDEEFKKSVNDIQNIALDMAESQLHKQILNGNTTATIFYLKTKGKKRGYQENQAIDLNTTGEINVNFKDLISAVKNRQ